MPELPEVETIRRSLDPQLKNRMIAGGEVFFPKLIENMTPETFLNQVSGQEVVRLERRGKYLIIHLADQKVIVVHLRMTGQLIMEDPCAPIGKATHLRLRFTDGLELRYKDQRKFGRVWLMPVEELTGFFSKMGPEPLGEDFTAEILEQRLCRHRLAIKKALLNQEILAGMGNIYADEALFLAEIHPARETHTLSETERKKLYDAIRQVLNEGIRHRGTTKRDYCDGEGKPGSYQEQLRVYGRKGQACPRCGSMIVKMTLGGRGTHFCPLCQA